MKAAQYVRMSTEHQKYSTENQAAAIAQYAANRGIEIVRTYADEGRSGLHLDGRHALKRLLDDVRNQRANFSLILVYDVSRWGRFQDADESASLEFECRRAGVKVQYCAEQFDNDGSLAATIIKNMKRAMAGEYSRELSVKVFAGQRRLTLLGFRQGGYAGLGLRRQLIAEDGRPKGVLAHGEHKSIQSDRIVLVPGPTAEVELVRRVFQMYAIEGRSTQAIASTLNDEGILTAYGHSWKPNAVRKILTNEKYIGNNVFNRSSGKLKSRQTANDRSLWIRCDGAFQAIVEPEIFYAAQRVLSSRYVGLSDSEMLSRLARVLARRGRLSLTVLNDDEGAPSSSSYRQRFGGLLHAYRGIGHVPSGDFRYVEINRVLRDRRLSVISEAVDKIQELGTSVRRDAITDVLTINEEITLSFVVARCTATPGGALRWLVRFDSKSRSDITVVIRMDAENKVPLDYYIFPEIDRPTPKVRLAKANGPLLDAYRVEKLDHFLHLASRAVPRVTA